MLNEFSLAEPVKRYLSQVSHAAGETVQLGWFFFRILRAGSPPRIQSLDFKAMASWTEDFSAAERLHERQRHVLRLYRVPACPCTLRDSACVSVSYRPGHPCAYMERLQSVSANDSGWYVGTDEGSRRDAHLELRSLYELTIHDDRLAPFWLLPVGTKVRLCESRSIEDSA
jgi:hypothetical protein